MRALPLSSKRGFSRRALAQALAEHGIAYAHVPTLGCPKPIRDRYKSDGDWTRYSAAFTKDLGTQSAAVTELAEIGNRFSRGSAQLFAFGFMETNGGAYKLFDRMADLVARAIRADRDDPAPTTPSCRAASHAARLRSGLATCRA